VNVASSRFHEGQGARKIDPPGGHIIVSRKEKLEEKIVTERNSFSLDFLFNEFDLLSEPSKPSHLVRPPSARLPI